MRITLSGTLGSGKSTVGKELARRLNIPYISTGHMFRELGQISSLDALQTNLEAETNRTLDDAVDNKVRELNKTKPDFVIDSRMAWHFVDDALRVFLSVTPETAAHRVMQDNTRSTEQYASFDAALDGLRARRDSEIKRYKRLYNVDIEDPSNYEMFIITDDAEVPDVADLILRRLHGETQEKTWIPKTRLVPMIPAPDPRDTSLSVVDSETARLPLFVAENFGFYFGAASDLAWALRSPLNLLGYEHRLPQIPTTPDPIAYARSTLKSADLLRWAKLSGTPLAFQKKLGGE